MKKIKIVITGVTGRMGMQIAKRVLKDKSLVLYGATERSGHKAIGKDLGQLLKTKKLKIKVTDNIIPLFAKTDAVIDFTTPEATMIHTKYAAQARIVHIIGTTGFNNSQLKKIKLAAQHATIIKSGNMSLGINLINKLIKIGSSSLNNDFDMIINEKEIVSIIGPNGAGKSTLLKAIMGIINISGGRFFIDGVEKTNTPTHQIVNEGVGYVPQVENVFPSLTIEENLEIGSWSIDANIKQSISKIFDETPHKP